MMRMLVHAPRARVVLAVRATGSALGGHAANAARSGARSMSILGTIFGIGEFEGARDQSLRATTSKVHAYNLALLEVRMFVNIAP